MHVMAQVFGKCETLYRYMSNATCDKVIKMLTCSNLSSSSVKAGRGTNKFTA